MAGTEATYLVSFCFLKARVSLTIEKGPLLEGRRSMRENKTLAGDKGLILYKT